LIRDTDSWARTEATRDEGTLAWNISGVKTLC